MSCRADIRILVVEDDCLFRAVLEKRLGMEGFQVFGAADGREGMKVIVAEEPHLVLSDWMMPHVDGLELCQSIKTSFGDKAPYFILLTARGQVNDRLLALETGADEYLVKPCDMGEIVARVRTGVRIIHAAHSLRHADELLEERNRRILQLASLLPACPRCGRVCVGNGHYEDPAQWLDGAHANGKPTQPCPDCGRSSFAA